MTLRTVVVVMVVAGIPVIALIDMTTWPRLTWDRVGRDRISWMLVTGLATFGGVGAAPALCYLSSVRRELRRARQGIPVTHDRLRLTVGVAAGVGTLLLAAGFLVLTARSRPTPSVYPPPVPLSSVTNQPSH